MFWLWGQKLLSDIDLGLAGGHTIDFDVAPIRIQNVPDNELRNVSRTGSLDCLNPDGGVWLTISRSDTAYVLEFADLCSFRINPRQRLIEYASAGDSSLSTVVHLILDHALPRLISLWENYFVLHASAVVVGEAAVLVLGESGAGKSTMASRFGAQGYPILTDDCLVLHKDRNNRWLALPSYPSVRLWPDSIDAVGIDNSALREFAHYSGKRRTGDPGCLQFASEPVPLGGAFVLKPGEPGRSPVEACSVSDAFAALSLGVFRLEITSPEMNRREFEILTDLVEKMPFWSVSHGNDYTQLPEIQKRMLEVLPWR